MIAVSGSCVNGEGHVEELSELGLEQKGSGGNVGDAEGEDESRRSVYLQRPLGIMSEGPGQEAYLEDQRSR